MFFTITAKFSELHWLGEIFLTASNTLLQVYKIYLLNTPKAFGGTGHVTTWEQLSGRNISSALRKDGRD